MNDVGPPRMSLIELRAGNASVRIVPHFGGRIIDASLEDADGSVRAVLHPCPKSSAPRLPWPKGGLFPLIPYSGRIGHSRLQHEGQLVHLAPQPGGEPHTLHGIAQQRSWMPERIGQDHTILRYRHRPDVYWPWHFEALLELELSGRRLRIDMSLRNLDTGTIPAGIGLHPYLPHARGTSLQFDAEPPWPFNSDYLAQAQPGAPAEPRRITVPAVQFESGEVTLFHGDWTGTLTLGRGDGTTLRLSADGALTHLVVHRPANAPYVCVEPFSHVADGFNLHARGVPGTGTRVLAPGETLQGSVEIGCGQAVA